MRTAAVALLALCIGCASIVPIEEIAPVVASDALERLPQAGRRQIATGGIDFPLLATAVFADSSTKSIQSVPTDAPSPTAWTWSICPHRSTAEAESAWQDYIQKAGIAPYIVVYEE